MAKILMIDGDPAVAETLVPFLESAGHEIEVAYDRGRALAMLDAGDIELILIDPDEIGLDGLDFCRQVRRLDSDLPIAVISRKSGEEWILPALASGVDEYLPKPVSYALLLGRIDALLRRVGARIDNADRQFAAMRRMLDAAWEVPLKPSVRSPLPAVAAALADSLRATYCRLALREGATRLRIRAAAGRRLGQDGAAVRAWSLDNLPYAVRALRDRRSIPMDFDFEAPERFAGGEHQQLFTPLTKSGVLIPFASDRVEGLLIVGEERLARHEPFQGEHLAMLEYVGHRIGDILRMSDLIRRVRIAERRRQLQAVKRLERARLARELHDEVGQSLSGLLLRLRLARTEGGISLADIDLLERTAQDALDAARSVAYDLRQQSGAKDAFDDARQFAQVLLGGAGCTLVWTDRREKAALDTRTGRTAARVIKESVTNIVRHSGARSTEITIEEASRRLRVTIRDDGQGFAPSAIMLNRKGRGLGLLGNRERLAQLGGTFQVDSLPGVGTSVVFELPLRRRTPVARAV